MSSLKRGATSPSSKDSKKREDECLICCKPATKDILECYWCEGRQHSACSKISEEQCKVLSEISSNVIFMCSGCLPTLPIAIKHYENEIFVDSRITAIEQSVTEIQCSERKLHESVEKVETKIESFQKSIESLLNEHTSSQPKTPASVNVAPVVPDSVEETVVSLLSEQKEKEKRQLNIIVHKLEESTASDGPSKKQEDIKKCESLFQSHLGTKVTIKNAIRLGKKTDRPRLLKLTLNSIEEKVTILRNKSKLRSSSNPEDVRNVFITPDFTPLEQKRNKALRQQLFDMNKAENVYVIKNGKIVRRQT